MANSGRKGPGRDSTSAKVIETAARHAEWMKHRMAAKSYREIADMYDVSPSTVQEAVVRRLRESLAEPANELRELELGRIDSLIAVCWDEATKLAADAEDHELRLSYIEQARKLLLDRRKLLGVEGATKVQHSFEAMSDDDLAAELAKLGVSVSIGAKE